MKIIKKISNFLKNLCNWFDKNNVFFIFAFFVLVFFILVFSLYKLQIKKGESYNQRVISQSKANPYALEKIKKRGTIFFQKKDNKKVAVALQKDGYEVAINPRDNKYGEKFYKEISKVLEIDKENFFKKANKKNDPYEEIADKISKEKMEEIRKLNLAGVFFARQSWRIYPFGKTSAKTIGFTNREEAGIYGIERFYEDILKRENKKQEKNIFQKLFEENEISKKNNLVLKEGDLISSIDIGLSKFVEKTLEKIDKKYNSRYSGAIVIKPKTGEIVAMTDTENFDINKKEERKDYRNKFIEHRFEVGSVLKPLVVAIGFDSQKLSPDFSYNDKGCVDVLDRTICNFDKKGRGQNTNIQKIISESLNTGMIEIEKRIGHKNFLDYLIKMEISQETGIDILGEIASDISNLENDYNDVDYASASFGQGIAFTPIGITKILSSIANDGFLIEPKIVQKIEYGGLIPDDEFEKKSKKIFSLDAVEKTKNILIKRADRYAENKSYYNSFYSVAAKTGTAQIPSPDGGYYEDRNLHTFFGFFPANAKPEDRYAIFLFTMEPKNVKFSSETMTEPFYDIMNFMIPYFDIRPDRI